MLYALGFPHTVISMTDKDGLLDCNGTVAFKTMLEATRYLAFLKEYPDELYRRLEVVGIVADWNDDGLANNPGLQEGDEACRLTGNFPVVILPGTRIVKYDE